MSAITCTAGERVARRLTLRCATISGMRIIKSAALLLAVIITLAGCTKKGESVWDTTPIPTTQTFTLTVPAPTP